MKKIMMRAMDISRTAVRLAAAFLYLFLILSSTPAVSVELKGENAPELSENCESFFRSLSSTAQPGAQAAALIPDLKSQTVPVNRFNITTATLYCSYKDDEVPYLAFPTIIAIGTGKNTEIDFLSDFLIYMNPNWGFNDLSINYKWHICGGDPSVALIGLLTVPTASAGQGVPEMEPGIELVFDKELGRSFSFTLDAAVSKMALLSEHTLSGGRHKVRKKKTKASTAHSTSNVRPEAFTHYFWQGIYSFEVDYNPDDSHTYSIGLDATCPNTYPLGTNTTLLSLGYSLSPTDSTQCSLTVIKGLSPVDVDWGALLQFTKGF